MVSLYSEIMVLLITLLLLDNRDFLFYPTPQTNLTLFTHIIVHQTSKIHVRNASNESLCISYCHKLGHLINIAYKNYFLTDTQCALNVATSPPSLYQPLVYSNNFSFLLTDLFLEIVLDNGVKVYKNAAAVR